MALFLGAVVCCTEKENADSTNGNNVATNDDNNGENNGDNNGGDNGGNSGGDTTIVNDVWVDLGLPSGTKWKNENEVNAADTVYNFYTYNEAVAAFGNDLPTNVQLQELKDVCQWTWIGGGYRATGPNDNSIVLPAAGYRNCDGSVNDVGAYGDYWSSKPYGTDYAIDLYFYSGVVGIGSLSRRCSGRSVRLVKD